MDKSLSKLPKQQKSPQQERVQLPEYINKICKDTAVMGYRRWGIPKDEVLSECYLWYMTHLSDIKKWETLPERQRNGKIYLSLKRLTALMYNTQRKEYIERELSLASAYEDDNKLNSLLFFMGREPKTITKKEWDSRVSNIDYRESLSIVTELNAISFNLSDSDLKFLKEFYQDGLSYQELADLYSIKLPNAKQKQKRIVDKVRAMLYGWSMAL